MENVVKKVILSLLIFSMIIAIYAVPQTEQTAREVTENFLLQRNGEHSVDFSYTINDRGENLLYIFNLQPEGFVAVSADSDLPPVIAYSFNQILLNEERDENLLHVMLRNDLNLRKSYFQDNPTEALENQVAWEDMLNNEQRDDLRFQQWPAAGTTITDGWVETQWNQSGVYNQMCPLDNSGGRSVVGCVATAMAMIMDYHQYIGNPIFTNADDYTSWGGMYIDNDHETRDFPSFPELNNYLQDVATHYAAGISLTGDDKASLNFACGVTVEMSYSSTGSGAWTSEVASALVNKFDYDSAEYLENYGYSFYELMIDNLQSMKPTELTIYQPGYEGGHAIICDGYNTNDYYHLNFGWGNSNNTCWYTLPTGMPSGYTIITGAVVNIEGGIVPIAVQGDVNVNGASPEGTYITFVGPRFYECFVEDTSGNFEIPAMIPGTYTVIATLEQRAFYQCIEDVIVDENNHFVQIDLGEFDQFTGTVSAPISAENASVTLFLDGEVAYTGITDANGDFAIPEVLPGNYFATASLAGNYFTSESVLVTLDDQTEDFELSEYLGNMSLSHAGANAGIWNLIPNYTISCAIKLTSDELVDLEDDVISGVRFKAPISDDEGELYAQVWIGDVLMSETEITTFSAGEWLDIDLNSFVTIVSDQEFYVGYKIYSETGAMVYRDEGPRITGKGAFFRNGSWIQLAANNDFNFCIEAKIITQEFGSLSGIVELGSGNGNLQDTVVRAGKYSIHPNEDGNYFLDLKAGIYDLSADLFNYETGFLNDVIVMNDEITEDQDFFLGYTLGADDMTIVTSSRLIGNYPNPFNPSTTISFITTESTESIEISIYNLKGQKVKTLVRSEFDVGQHSIVWNGIDETGNNAGSGMYFAKMKAGGRYTSTKKLILLK